MTNNNSVQDTLALVGRVLVAWLFIPAGWGKIAGFSGVAGYIASKGVPLPEVCAAIAIAAELGLGLLLLVGWQARWAALGLAIFIAVITPIFHGYWALPAAEQMMQKQAFDKNIAVLGGLLVLTAFGAGRFSLDGRRGKA
ncbi:DoxX family protein [Ramlibacter sp. WS9]|uniref:DoxX family protein n=1 Tax=Ramlibacter sp. WS9 TaxID=1882741 RepID=UPI001141C2C1|nr:DoxX family protein [Ramlibacter sp. WS9]ROZ75840.1 DoxX family protein [Ramlibacter sp. WS9]